MTWRKPSSWIIRLAWWSADRAADPALRRSRAIVVEARRRAAPGLEEQRVVEPFEAPGPILLGDAQQHRDRLGRHVRVSVQALAQRAGEQAREPRDAAPGLLERHLGADDPVAAAAR